MARKNRIREILEEGSPSLSTHIHSVWPSEIEAIGHTGLYDYVEFVAEYGPSDIHDLDNLCRTAELYNLGSMIKIDEDFMEMINKLKEYYQVFSAKWAAVLADRKSTKTTETE